MATTPNAYGRFIGRVGALAVALGIGAAIANSPGVALAQDRPSDTSDTSDASGTAASTDTGSTTNESISTAPADTIGGSAQEVDEDSGDDGAADDAADDEDVADDGAEEANETDDEETAPPSADDASTSGSETDDQSEASAAAADSSSPMSKISSQTVISSPDTSVDDSRVRAADMTESQPDSAVSTFAAVTSQAAESTTEVSSPAATVTTGLGGLVETVLSALGFGPQAASGPAAPPEPPMLWAMLGWVRREVGNIFAPFAAATAPVAALVADEVTIQAVSPLATEEQLAAERIATQTANSLPVALMKLVLRQGFLAAANELYPDGPDEENLALLDEAVNEYAMGAAFQQQLLDSMRPQFITQVAPPHVWFGQSVPGSRILYDNPDTIYRFTGVNGASEYVIRGQFLNYSPNDPSTMPADTSFSVLEGLAGTTSTILTVDDQFDINPDGTFEITVSREATGGPNHLQLTSASTIIAARNTLGNWNAEEPMSLSIERVGGPPNSLFAQIGGFAFLGPLVTGNPLLTTLVSLVPPLPMPPVVRGVFTAVILVVRGANEQREYMALATNDPETGEAREPNELPQPSSNAEFLANQLQSNGNFQLADGEALVLTIDPGRANYFVVPTYNIWTITDDYWNEQTSLNNEQAVANDNGTYTVVISPTDPGVTNWISTGGLNQGAISIRFQDLGPDENDQPTILAQHVVSVDGVDAFFENDPIYFVDAQERANQLAARKEGFNKRWAPFPQP